MKYIIQGILGAFLVTAALHAEPVIILNEKNYEATVKAYPYVIVDVYADWCGPCKKLAPVIEELNGEYGDRYRFTKLNSSVNDALIRSLNIKGLPTILFYKNGKEVGRSVGYINKEKLLSLAKEYFNN